MNVKEFSELSGLKCLNPESLSDKAVSGVFIGDLLSWVMGNAKEGQLLITVQGHLNVIAVAVLSDLSGVILAHNAIINEDSLARAIEEKIPVFETEMTAYECAKLCTKLGL